MRKKLCPNCDRRISSCNYNQHTRSCFKMPNMEEFKRIIPTLSVPEMIQLWGVTDSAIWSRLNSIGMRAKRYTRHVLPSKEEAAQVITLYQQNLSYKVIGKKVGISIRQVEGVIKRAVSCGEIEKRRRIFIKSDDHRCAFCGIPLVHATTPPGEGNLCGFCIDEWPVIPEGNLSGLANDVVAVAILDASNGHPRRRKRARIWLASDTADWWSDAAGLDPEFTQDQARKAGAFI